MSSLGLEFIVLAHVALLLSPALHDVGDDESDQCDWRDATILAATWAGGRGS